MPVSSVTEHWIKQDAITINLNHFGDPDYLQVSVLAGAVVMAFKQDVIGYNAAHNYRTWPLQAANTYLENTSAVNVYARLTRSEVNASALIIYDPVLRDIEGRAISYAEDGSEILGEADTAYFYIFLGQISSSINNKGEQIEREWEVSLRFGNLDTSQYRNEEAGGEWMKMFRLNKVTDMIDALRTFSSAVFNSAVIKKLFIGEKEISDIQRSSDEDKTLKIDDTTIPTTQYSETRYLSKVKDDRSKGKISSDKAIEVGNYVSGASGAIIYKDTENGQTVAEFDKLYVRMKAYFETLEIINVNTIGGKQIISPAGSVRCIGVEETDNAYRCYFLAEQDGEKVQNRFLVYDQIYSQMFDAVEGTSQNVSTHYFWRLCIAKSKEPVTFENKSCHYIDLSKTDCDKDSDVPMVGDVLNQRGNRTDLDRMNFIEMSSVDAFSPNITLFHGVNSYSLDGKAYVSYGVDKSTNKAFMDVYGDMYVGDRQNNSYMRYTQENGLEISGTLSIGTKLGDTPLKDLISASSPEGYQEFVEKVTQDIEGLQAQIDGAIESYFYQYDPTLDNYPASEWITEEQKKAHLNDTFTNVSEDSGHSWRWSLVGTTYNWVEIKDTATAKALQVAGQAKDTADGKRRVFVDTPYPPYDKGDLWSRGSEYPLMICVKEKDKNGVYEASDFDYADNNAKLKEEMQELVGETKDELNNAIGQAKNEAVNNANAYTNEGKKALQASIDAMESSKANLEDVYTRAQADGKISDSETKAINAAKEQADAAIALSEVTIKAYADGIVDEEEAARIKQAQENLDAAKKYAKEQAQIAIDEANDTYGYLAKALGTEVDGGLLLTSLIQMRDTDQNIMSGINGLTAKGDKSIATWWGGGMHDMFDYYDWDGAKWVAKKNIQIPSNVPSGVIRMDGTGYLAKGKFWWDDSGKIYADPTALFLMFDVEDESASLSQTILAMRDKQTEFESMWEFKTDANGRKYLLSKYPLVTQEGITMYSGVGTAVPSIYDGLPIDGVTIYWENGILKAQGGGGTGGGGSIDFPLSWSGFSSGSFDGSAAKTIYIPSKLSELTNDSGYALSSALSKYLPLSGGKLTSSNYNVLSIVRATTAANYGISLNFSNSNGEVCNLVAHQTTHYFSRNYNGTNYVIWDSGNFNPSDYLPINGGTISNDTTTPLIVNSTESIETNVRIQRNGVNKAVFGYKDGIGTRMRSSVAGADLIITDDGLLKYGHEASYYTVYHRGNFNPSDYLPKSGGTITNSSIGLTINRSTSSTPWVAFQKNGADVGRLGSDLDKPIWYDAQNYKANTILHEGNYSSYALPLSGGTISNADYGALNVLRESTQGFSAIGFSNWSGMLGYLGIGGSGSTFPNQPTFVDTSFNAYGLIHSGNIGSQSVNYASDSDKLDGLHANELLTSISSGSSTNLSITIGGTTKKITSIYSQYTQKFHAIWNNPSSGSFDLNTHYNGGIVRYYGSGGSLTNAPTSFGYGSILSLTSGNEALSGQLAWNINHGSTSDVTKNLYWRASDSSNVFTYAKWHQIAFTDSNVASATKLQTTRTIWGKSFDGTENVNGVLTLGTNYITGNDGADILNSQGQWCYLGGGTSEKGFPTYIDGHTIRLRYGTSHTEGVRISSLGNVGIGTTTPEHKLDVSGNIRTNGNIYAAAIELLSSTPFIDFHFNNDTADYTSRIIEESSGELTCKGRWKVGGALTARSTLSVSSTSTFTGKTTHNGGIGATSGTFSSTLAVTGATTLSSSLSVGSGLTVGTVIQAESIELVQSTPHIDFRFNKSTANYTSRFIEGLSGQLTCVGKFRIGLNYTTSTDYNFYVSGSAYISSNLLTGGSITMNSMRSMKNIINENGLSLEELSTIKPIRFTWKDGRDDRIHVGGIADDVMKVLPEVVFKGSDGVLSMDYASAAFVMAASLIKPITEHERRIANLERENALLKEEIRNLKSA